MHLRSISFILMLVVARALAQSPVELLKTSGLTGGLIVHLGCGDGRETLKLREGPAFLVHGLDTSDVGMARQYILKKGAYGPVAVAQLHGTMLPYVDNLINVMIVEEQGAVTDDEITRVLCPLGKAYIRAGASWTTITKPWTPDIDQWTHYLRGPDNNAVSQDMSIGAPRSLRWVAPPRWGRSHEEMSSMSAAVSANGRLFHIIDDAPLVSIRYPAEWKLIARDAFNGTKLWEKPIGNWIDHLRHFRAGPTHLPRRLVAVGDKVYVTLGLDAPLTCLDAKTGNVIKTYNDTEHTEEIVVQNDTLYLMIGSSEISRLGGGLSERGEPKPSRARHLVVLDAETGKELWRKNARDADYVLPLSLTGKGERVFYHSVKGLHCVNANNGSPLWVAKRPTPAARYAFSTSTLVVTDDVVLLADLKPDPTKGRSEGVADGNPTYPVHGWNEPGYARKGPSELTAYAAADGKTLWSAPCTEGYNAPVDVFVIDDIVWIGPKFANGYDLRTGTVSKTLDVTADPVGMVHARCHRNKAAASVIFTCRDGIETIDLAKGWTGNNSWVRGTCQYGILPANGLIYAPPNACACHPKIKLQGVVALASELPACVKTPSPAIKPQLTRGPAFGRLTTLAEKALPKNAWPVYRADSMRSGATTATVKGTASKWRATLGGKLTQPVVGHGNVYVASSDTHTIHALNARTGTSVWTFTTGGRIDCSPSLYKGLLIAGSADGHVYCLDAANGDLAWSFRAAPEERLISVFGQLESAWPVHGSVLVQTDEIIFTAGRNTYLDGGITFYRMDPITGQVLASTPIRHLDPLTDKQTGKEGGKHGLGFDSEGTASDVLSGNGTSVFIKHMRFDLNGKEQPRTVPHLFCQTGMLGEEWFVRSYWTYGTDVGAGWGGWASMRSNQVRISPAGRILTFDEKHAYGYGRVRHLAAATGHRADAYHLFSSPKVYTPPKPPPTAPGTTKKKAKKASKTYRWSNVEPFIVRAMALTDNRLVIAGVPDLGKKKQHELEFANPEEALNAYLGGQGGILRTVSKTDGTTLDETKLPAAPVFDGLSAALGHIYISLKDGSVICLGK
jgi:outer membrane protein assembly factor BamB